MYGKVHIQRAIQSALWQPPPTFFNRSRDRQGRGCYRPGAEPPPPLLSAAKWLDSITLGAKTKNIIDYNIPLSGPPDSIRIFLGTRVTMISVHRRNGSPIYDWTSLKGIIFLYTRINNPMSINIVYYQTVKGPVLVDPVLKKKRKKKPREKEMILGE